MAAGSVRLVSFQACLLGGTTALFSTDLPTCLTTPTSQQAVFKNLLNQRSFFPEYTPNKGGRELVSKIWFSPISTLAVSKILCPSGSLFPCREDKTVAHYADTMRKSLNISLTADDRSAIEKSHDFSMTWLVSSYRNEGGLYVEE